MKRLLTALAAAALLAGCATPRPYGAALDEYLPFAGPPIRDFHFWELYSWEAVGPYQIVLWATPWEAYFVTVAQPCINLEWAHRVGVTSTAGTVSHFESVLVGHGERCPIIEIRAIDTKQLRVARKQRAIERESARKGGAPAPATPPAQPAAAATAT